MFHRSKPTRDGCACLLKRGGHGRLQRLHQMHLVTRLTADGVQKLLALGQRRLLRRQRRTQAIRLPQPDLPDQGPDWSPPAASGVSQHGLETAEEGC